MPSVKENYRAVRKRMLAALAKAGRPEGDCTLVAASKYASAEQIAELAGEGHHDFGENKVQDAEEKKNALFSGFPGIVWHMIGHLQTNKAAKAAGLFDVIQTADSERLLQKLEKASSEAGKVLPVMVQVNISREQTKSGATRDTAIAIFRSKGLYPHLDLCGLMTMPPFSEDPETSRPFFRGLRQLRGEIVRETGEGAIRYLSMGMSGDLEVAIEEGANIIRVGSALFR
jgi:PLP dependent protein